MNSTSILICCKNVEHLIGQALASIAEQVPAKIIIVDGSSTDNTVAICKQFTSSIIQDPGKGLGYARSLGIQAVDTPYLIIMSPDDILPKDFVQRSTQEIKKSSDDTAALLAPKSFQKTQTFWDRAQNEIYKIQSRFPIRVVGNPSIYRTAYLKAYGYDKTFSANEDTDICERWSRNGLKVDWLNTTHALEIETCDFGQFKKRYIWYGEGDYRFCSKWLWLSPLVALRHFLHPLYTYMIVYSIISIVKLRFGVALFAVLCGIFRYEGFFASAFKHLLRK
jgi:glycosyltransferase involved in cell wall biosynthesis